MGLGDLVGGLVGGGSEDEDGGALDDGEGDIGGEFGDDEDFDDLGGWEDEEDELDDLGGDEAGGGGAAADLEPRLDELEEEMERISSTMGTVRSENESITETVDDIEDNVRQLLEIYEMVTRGVNPFVDEAEEGDTMGDGFSLFDGGGGGGGGGADPEVADADGDSFFDDDWDEGEPIDDDLGEGIDAESLEADAPAAEPDEEADSDGKTFDELKSEYQEGDAEWEDDDALTDDGADETEGVGTEEPEEPEPAPSPTVDADPTQSDEEAVVEDGKPYLTELPGGYGADLLVMEWLSFLRAASSTPETLRAIRYYETIGWVGPGAAESLAQYLSGLGAGEPRSGADGSTQLTIDHHTRSLGYIGKLGGTDIQTGRLQWRDSTGGQLRQEGGTHRGIQR